MILAGAISFVPDGACRRLASAIAERSSRVPGLRTTPLLEGDRVACYSLAPPGQPTPTWEHTVEGRGRIAVIGRPLLGASELAVAFEGCLDERVSAVPAPARRWVALIQPAATGALRLLSDPLGTSWIFLARTRDGYLFASDFAALVASLPDRPAIDWETAHAMLAISYAPDDRTCLEGVTVLPGGTLLELAPSGLRVIASRRPTYGDRFAGETEERKFTLLDEIYSRTVREWFDDSDEGLLLSLSGGNDSRYGLSMLQQRGLKPACVTFGHPRGYDGHRTQAMDRALHLGLTRYYEGDVTSWESWQRSVEQVGTIGGFQWIGWSEEWLRLLQSRGTRAALGFLGDALTGVHLVPGSSPGLSWIDHWEAWSLDEGWTDARVLRPEAARRIREITRARFEAVAGDVAAVFPHQIAMHLDLYGRQRRHVASQLNLMDRYLEPIPYFYTDYGMEFWSNLGWEDLSGQRLYLAYAASRFPRFFQPPGIQERVFGTVVNAVGRVWPGVRRALMPPDIDIPFLIGQNRDAFVALARETADLLATFAEPRRVVASIEGFPRRSEMTSVQIIRLVNLLLLLRLGAGGSRVAPPD